MEPVPLACIPAALAFKADDTSPSLGNLEGLGGCSHRFLACCFLVNLPKSSSNSQLFGSSAISPS
jgi:hypothetical protein